MIYANKEQYQNHIENLFRSGKISLRLYTQLNNKSAQENYMISRQFIRDNIIAQREKEEEQERQKLIEAATRQQVEKDLPQAVSKAVSELLQGLKSR